MNTTWQTLISIQNLTRAWKEVKSGGAAGGIDQMTISTFDNQAEAEIASLAALLKEEKYLPAPYKEIHLLKSNGQLRELGMLTIRDKVVQMAVLKTLEPVLEPLQTNASYAYRPAKGPQRAVKRTLHILQHEKPQAAVSCDFKNYFDTIDHTLLFKALSAHIKEEKILRLIELCIKMGRVRKDESWKEVKRGVPQGAILSPALANFFLLPLDRWMLENKIGYLRYADDFIALCKTKQQAAHALQNIQRISRGLGLELKPGSKVQTVEIGFSFLGLWFNPRGVQLDKQKQSRLKEKIKNALQLGDGTAGPHFGKTLDGIRNFYGSLLPQEQLFPLDEYLKNRLIHLLSIRKPPLKTLKAAKGLLNGVRFLTPEYDNNRKLVFDAIARAALSRDAATVKPDTENETATAAKEKTVEQKIAIRRREYEKKAGQSMELVVHTFGAFISKTKSGIQVKYPEKKPVKFSSANLRHITILSNGVSLSSDVISFCMEHDITLTFFTRAGKHYATIRPPWSGDGNLWQQQAEARANEQGQLIAIELVEAKLRNQINLLKYLHKYHKTADPGFALAFAQNLEKAEKVRTELDGLPTDLSLNDLSAKLFSIEGRGAAIYWDLLRELLDDDVPFEGRERKGARDLVNSMLNYGYSLIYARVWDALLRARLNPNISFLHTPKTNEPTLAFDLIEPFRPQAVDRVVVALLQKGENVEQKDGWLTEETRKLLTQNIYERLYRMENYRGERMRLFEIIIRQAKELAQFISGEKNKFKPWIAKW